MSLPLAVRQSFGIKVALIVTAILIALTAVAAAYITTRGTDMMTELTMDKARLAATLGAREYGDVLDEAIDNGVVTVNNVFDHNYVEIKGYPWGSKPKYHTKYDFVCDRAVLIFQDTILQYDDDFVFAVGTDENGYVPTHNTRYQRPLTGDPARDLAGNRTKRVFDDPVGSAAGKNLKPILVQAYKQDTGISMWDVSAPIYVKGKHWGAFRIGVSMEKIEARRHALLLALLVIFGLFTLTAVGTISVMIRRAMRPIEFLTVAADQISLGEALDSPVKLDSMDEIGRMAKAIDRLRASMRVAISRLDD